MGLRFECEFDCNSSEFAGDYFPLSVYYAVRRVATKIEETRPTGAIHSQSIMDLNGNRIGTWKIVET